MADYVKALQKGFAAAEKADRARKEIQEVLTEFKSQVLDGTAGEIMIEVKEFTEQIPDFLKALKFVEPGKTYLALAARNPKLKNPSFKILARWAQSKDGYPCVITIGNKELQCENRVALEQGLAGMLQDPGTGEILYSLTKAG